MMLMDLELEGQVLSEMLEVVHRHTGISMNDKKKTMLQSRIRPRLRELALPNYEAYLSYLASHKEEIEIFIDCVTTNETFFFRTHRVWDYFQKQFLPEWYKHNPGSTLKIWSGASSSGEEPYSLVMCMLEFKLLNPNFKFELIASDISQEILTKAKTAVFDERSVDGVRKYRPDWFPKYILSHNGKWTVQEELKKHVKFFTHNLMTPSTQTDQDIIFLRNVMIYFNDQDQKTVLKHLAKTFKPGGVLVLGESESIARLETDFKYVEPLVYSL